MAGYIDDGGGSKNVEMPDKKSKKVAPEDQGNLSLVAPRVLSGLVLSNNGVSKVPLQGAKIEVKQPRIQSDSPPRSPNRMPKRAPSYHMPKSPPPSPPSGHSRIVPDDIDEIPVKTRVAFDEDEVTSSPAARSPTKMARSPSGRTVLRSPSKMLKQGTFRRSRRSSITAETVLKTIQTEDVDTAGKPNYKLELFKGSYNITFSAPGHASQDQSVNLGEKGQPAASTLNVTLVPRVYKLSGAVMTSAALSTQPPSAAGATQAASRAIPGEAKPGAIQSDKDVKVAEYMFQLADTSGDGLVDEEELLVLSVKLMKKKGQVADETDLRTFVTTQRPHPETPAEFDFDAFVGVYNALVAHMAGEEPLPSSAAGSAESEPPVDVTPTPRSAPQGCTPLEGAKLLILDDNGEEIKTLMSGKGGAFDVSLPAGNYTRRVILDGYTTKFDKIEIADDLVSDVHLEVVLYDLI
jgi:hypothetical protein